MSGSWVTISTVMPRSRFSRLISTMISALLTIPLIGTQRTFLAFALVIAVVAAAGLGSVRWAAIPVALAAALFGPDLPETVICTASGGNVDPVLFADVLQRLKN